MVIETGQLAFGRKCVDTPPSRARLRKVPDSVAKPPRDHVGFHAIQHFDTGLGFLLKDPSGRDTG